jgi:hypothetical protein
MNMLEVHYQVRDVCRLAVGSQEAEPGDGWPYDAVLARLAAAPAMAPEELGRAIVDAYADFYQAHHPGLPVTQSAVRLAGIDGVVETLSGLAQALIAALADRATLGLLFGALRSAQSFSDRDYVDLAHFCQLLAEADAGGAIGRAARPVAAALLGAASPVIAERHQGPAVANAHGLSIYLPARTLSPLYSQLEFARQHNWDDFLDAFLHPSGPASGPHQP